MLIKNKIKILLANVFLILFVFVPTFVFSAETGNTGIVYECVDGKGIIGNCDFNDLIAAIVKITNFLAVFALSLTVVVIAYAGYKYMISGDNAGERKAANTMLLKVVKGIIFILLAWLIVTLITGQLLDPSINVFLK